MPRKVVQKVQCHGISTIYEMEKAIRGEHHGLTVDEQQKVKRKWEDLS